MCADRHDDRPRLSLYGSHGGRNRLRLRRLQSFRRRYNHDSADNGATDDCDRCYDFCFHMMLLECPCYLFRCGDVPGCTHLGDSLLAESMTARCRASCRCVKLCKPPRSSAGEDPGGFSFRQLSLPRHAASSARSRFSVIARSSSASTRGGNPVAWILSMTCPRRPFMMSRSTR